MNHQQPNHHYPPPPPNYSQQQYYPQGPPKKNNTGMIILIVVIALVAAAGAFFAFKSMSKNDTPLAQQPINQLDNNQAQQNNSQPQQNNNQATANVPIDFVKTMEGKINNKYDVTMKLTANGGQITGSYFYKSQGGSLTVNGTIDADGNVNLTEYDSKGNMTGKFSGKMTNGNKLEGNWNKPNGGNTMPFYLIESNANYNASQQQTQQNNTAPAAIPGNFAGRWNGDVHNQYDKPYGNTAEMDIEQNGSKITGCIYSSEGGGWCFSGTVTGTKANLTVTDLKGNFWAKGTLTLYNAYNDKSIFYCEFVSNKSPKKVVFGR